MGNIARTRAIADWAAKCVALGITRDRPPCDLETGEPLLPPGTGHYDVPLKGRRISRIEIDWADVPRAKE